jgi:MFS transporter, MCT family, solute carrier family 16 (monocarboxylic acid transporters), member 10
MSGRLLDRGIYRIPLAVASLLLVALTVLVGSCKEYWHFLVVQGILTGVSHALAVNGCH